MLKYTLMAGLASAGTTKAGDECDQADQCITNHSCAEIDSSALDF